MPNLPQFSPTDTVVIYGDQPATIQAMLDYDYLCGKSSPSIVCIIKPQAKGPAQDAYFFGSQDVLIPVYRSLETAHAHHAPTILINFASPRSAFAVTKEALGLEGIEKIVIIAEGMPERETRLLRHLGSAKNVLLIGPATAGGLVSQVLKIGNVGGTTENILANHLQVPGSVGVISKSGGLLNEFMTIVNRASDGVREAIAIGGDRFPLTTLAEQILRFEENPDIKLILMQGEVGGRQELEVAELVATSKVTKPLVAWVSGTGAQALTENVQFGHAGAMANSEAETATGKLAALRQAGVLVPHSFAGLEELVRTTAVDHGLAPRAIPLTPTLPRDFATLCNRKEIRFTKQIRTSISKKIGSDATYLGKDIAETAAHQSLGHVIGLLWLKREVPESTAQLFELILKLTADHGPAVSGAHNTIVAARAGKDLVSSLVSGLLTIGPRFGGAVNESAKLWRWGVQTDLAPFDFVEVVKQKGDLIAGIGHRVKSLTNYDKRVTLLLQASETASHNHAYRDYALAVEKITTRKKDSLILNVDGAIAAVLLDVLIELLPKEEVDQLIAYEALNAFFVLGRSIGLIGHYIDQKRLGQPLYRHPEWDILETE